MLWSSEENLHPVLTDYTAILEHKLISNGAQFKHLSIYGSFQYKSTFFSCECPFLRCSHRVLASSRVDQFTKGQLSLDIWVLMELGLSLNQEKSARKRKQEIVEIS